MANNDSIDKWFNELTPDDGLGKAFIDYFKQEENKNKIVNVDKLKVFMDSVKNIKAYFFNNSIIVSFSVDPVNPKTNIGCIKIDFRTLDIINGKDLRNLSKNASYVELLITDGNVPQIVFGFRDLMDEVK